MIIYKPRHIKLCLLLMLTAIIILLVKTDTVNAQTKQIGDYLCEVSGNSVIIKGYYGKDDNVIVPNEIENKKVTAIGDYAFNNKRIRTISLPDTVTKIGIKAFQSCRDLQNVDLPSNVREIDNYAFSYCNSLMSVNLSKNLSTIKEGVFYCCDGLRTIDIPNNITKIERDAFRYNKNLQKIKLSDNLSEIGSCSFYGCSLLKDIAFPKNLKTIKSQAFCKCSLLNNIILPEQLNTIEFGAFSECSALNTITIPGNVKNIGTEAFYQCTNLNTAKINEGVTTIGDRCFAQDSNLKTVEIPKTVIEIGESAFNGGNYIWRKSVEMYVYKGTHGETYAGKNGFTFHTPEKPPRVIIKKAKSKKKSIQVFWKIPGQNETYGTPVYNEKGELIDYEQKTNEYVKYKVAYRQKNKKWKFIKTTKNKIVIKKLKKKKVYKIKIRAEKKYKGQNVYGPWSKVKTVKTKKRG